MNPWPGRPTVPLEVALDQAEALLEEERFRELIELLEPLAARHPRDADLHTYLGYSFIRTGDLWSAVVHYEKARSLRRDTDLLAPLAFLYVDLDLEVRALQAFRQLLKSRHDPELSADLPAIIEELEDQVWASAQFLGLPVDRATRGLRLFEEAQIALHTQDYARSSHLNRKAIRILAEFPPAQNNLSLALFFQGMPEEAIRVAREVAARHPDNMQALSNLVRFLAWTGEEGEARQVWARLKPLTPQDHTTRMKMAEAAAIMDADEDVYRLLRSIKPKEEADPSFSLRGQLHLAVAEANTGRRRAARRRLQKLQTSIPWAGDMLEALRAGKQGPGWAERFPYFLAHEMMPRREMESFLELLLRKDQMPAGKFRREVERFAARFPQLVLMGKKFLIEDQQPDPAIAVLTTLGTPEAYAVLREFGLGQVGDDESRLRTLFALSEAGQIPTNETIRVWQGGEWREIQLRQYEIVDEPEVAYPLRVAKLLDEATRAFQNDRLAEAEKLYQQILALEPRAKEAYNNLGALYARQEKHERARAMFQEAMNLDPGYVLPRCNLAIYLIDEDRLEAAEEMIAPLADITRLSPLEMAFLSYVRARIHVGRAETDQARNALEIATEVYPDYEPAVALLNRLDSFENLTEGWGQFWERRRKRDLARRERQRALLTAPDPSLEEALGIYTKDILTAIARRVILSGGWSAYRKAELHRYLVESLLEEGALSRVLESLTDDERGAFEHVRAQGGTLAWDEFDRKYGNDQDESPYWQYHDPETVMGRLRAHGLLVEVTVEGELLVSIPEELRS